MSLEMTKTQGQGEKCWGLMQFLPCLGLSEETRFWRTLSVPHPHISEICVSALHTHQRMQRKAVYDPRNEHQARYKLPRFPLRQENKTKPSFQSWKRNARLFLMPGACDFYHCFHLKIEEGNKRGT